MPPAPAPWSDAARLPEQQQQQQPCGVCVVRQRGSSSSSAEEQAWAAHAQARMCATARNTPCSDVADVTSTNATQPKNAQKKPARWQRRSQEDVTPRDRSERRQRVHRDIFLSSVFCFVFGVRYSEDLYDHCVRLIPGNVLVDIDNIIVLFLLLYDT